MDLSRIKAEIAAASPGPWMRNGKLQIGWRIDSISEENAGIAMLMNPTAIVPKEADANFVAMARQELPRLVDEIERLRGELEVAKRVAEAPVIVGDLQKARRAVVDAAVKAYAAKHGDCWAMTDCLGPLAKAIEYLEEADPGY